MKRKPFAITIEKNVKLPPPRAGACASVREILEPMNVGDSFITDYWDKSSTAASSLYVAGKALGYKFTTRQEGKKIRVWRVK